METNALTDVEKRYQEGGAIMGAGSEVTWRWLRTFDAPERAFWWEWLRAYTERFGLLDSYLELGSRCGMSLWMTAPFVREDGLIVSVDLDGRENVKKGDDYDSALSLQMRRRVAAALPQRVELILDRTERCVDRVAAFGSFQGLLIDADHAEQGCRRDWDNYHGLVRGNGFVAFHDTCIQRHGVRKVWPRVRDKLIHTRHFESGQGIGVGLRPPRSLDGAWRVFLTHRCPLKCSYCSQRGMRLGGSELDASAWARILRPARKVVLTGGEPLLHPQFWEVFDGLPEKCEVSVYTNGVISAAGRIPEVKRPCVWSVSYNPSEFRGSYCGVWLDNIKALAANPAIRVGVHAVWTEVNRPYWEDIRETARFVKSLKIPFEFSADMHSGRQVNFPLDPDCADWPERIPTGIALRYDVQLDRAMADGRRRPAWCEQSRVSIAPNGRQYGCLTHTIDMNPDRAIACCDLGDPVIEGPFRRPCKDYGTCNLCDSYMASMIRPRGEVAK